MFDDGRDNPDPRSPVQPAQSIAPYVVAAIGSAAALWAIQQIRTQEFRVEQPVAQKDPVPRKTGSDLRTLFSGDDYPLDAQRNGEEGTVQARLSLDASGRVSACTIIRTSGHPSLDNATCSILQRRARFAPAQDDRGKGVANSVVTPPITWRLEG